MSEDGPGQSLRCRAGPIGRGGSVQARGALLIIRRMIKTRLIEAERSRLRIWQLPVLVVVADAWRAAELSRPNVASPAPLEG